MGERMTFKNNGTTTPGYLARPPRPRPGIIVIQCEVHTCPQAQLAFFNDDRPEVHDAAAAADARVKTIGFFRRELQG